MLEWASVCTRVCVRANGRFDFQALQRVLSEKQTNNNNKAKAEKHRCKKNINNNNKKKNGGKRTRELTRRSFRGERAAFLLVSKVDGLFAARSYFHRIAKRVR